MIQNQTFKGCLWLVRFSPLVAGLLQLHGASSGTCRPGPALRGDSYWTVLDPNPEPSRPSRVCSAVSDEAPGSAAADDITSTPASCRRGSNASSSTWPVIGSEWSRASGTGVGLWDEEVLLHGHQQMKRFVPTVNLLFFVSSPASFLPSSSSLVVTGEQLALLQYRLSKSSMPCQPRAPPGSGTLHTYQVLLPFHSAPPLWALLEVNLQPAEISPGSFSEYRCRTTRMFDRHETSWSNTQNGSISLIIHCTSIIIIKSSVFLFLNIKI